MEYREDDAGHAPDRGAVAGGTKESVVKRILEEMQRGAAEGSEIPFEDYIRLLDEHRKKCVAESNYEEAELAQHVLVQLRIQEEQESREEMRRRQLSEKRGIEDAHLAEQEEFQRLWESKLREYDLHSQEVEMAMRERHLAEFRQFHMEMTAMPAQRRRYSKALLDLRERERRLARQGKYSDARSIREKADKMQEAEDAVLSKKNAKSVARKESQLVARHKNELSVLHQRIERWRTDHIRQRDEDLKRISLRFENVKKGLEAAQNIEKARVEKFLLNHSTVGGAAAGGLHRASSGQAGDTSRSTASTTTATTSTSTSTGKGKGTGRGRGDSSSKGETSLSAGKRKKKEGVPKRMRKPKPPTSTGRQIAGKTKKQ